MWVAAPRDLRGVTPSGKCQKRRVPACRSLDVTHGVMENGRPGVPGCGRWGAMREQQGDATGRRSSKAPRPCRGLSGTARGADLRRATLALAAETPRTPRAGPRGRRPRPRQAGRAGRALGGRRGKHGPSLCISVQLPANL